MQKLLFSFFLLLTVTAVTAQEVNVVKADLTRRQFRNGIMILYYGENRLIKECSLWEVKFKKDESENSIAEKLKKRRAAFDPYIQFEFKEGFDCNNANSYLLKKGINKNSINSCIYIDFSENPEGAVLLPGNGTAAWNNPDRVTADKVDQLDTYSWALVNRVLEKRQKQLEQDGWQRVYTEYNLAGGPKDERWVGRRVSASPDSLYMAIGTVMQSTFKLKMLNADKLDEQGNPQFEFERDFNGGVLAETTPFRPKEHLQRLIFAGVSNDRVNTNNAGIIVFRKKYSMQDEFAAILADAVNNFTNYKLDETKDPNGVPVFNATQVFGLKKRMIFRVEETGNWMFCQFCNTDDPNATTLKAAVNDLIDRYVKTGNYLTESGDYKDDMIYRLNDKQGNILFQMAVGNKIISLNFFGNRNKTSAGTTTNGTTAVKKEEGSTEKNNSTTTGATSVPFIDPKKEYVFQNWNWANITFKWSWLETPSYDKNVSREFLEFSDKTGNSKDDKILRITQKTDGYTWAMATPNVGKFNAYTYSGIFGLAKAQGSDFGQGLMILLKDGKKGDYTRLYFLIDPIKQTYWFGSQNPNNNKWETHNHYTGDTYNIFSKAINKHNNNGDVITKNIVTIEKQTDKILLYINNQLVDTIDITKKNDLLNNFEGIGIVTVDKQISTVDKLTFAR